MGATVFRPALLIVGLWAIMAAPALCAAGVLAHECPCEDSAVCDHESECDADPCSDQILRRDLSSDELFDSAGLGTWARSPAIIRPLEAPRRAAPPRPGPTPPPGVRHASDRPRRI
jgi:hypothetical protein